jgi:hypothetical protein
MSRKTTAAIVKKLRRSFALVPAMSILIVGCSSSSNDAAAASNGSAGAAKSGQKSGGANYVKFDPLSGQVAKAAITDPTLNNMVAANLTIPAGWKLQGMMLMPPCAPAPYPVFRAYSPDGLMQFRYEPVFGWRWSSNYKPDQTGCAPISGVISAADFLKYYVETMQGGVHVVGTMPVPATTTQTAQRLATEANQNNSRLAPMMQHKNTGDAAALRVEVVNGSFVVEERLRVVVECAVNAPSGPLPAWAKQVKPVDGGTCWARLDVLTAPKGKLDTLVQLADSNDLPHGALTPEWNQASMRQLSEKNAWEGEQRLEGGRAESQAFHDMMYSAFQQNMARSASQHAAFMEQQESSFRSSMNNANAAMNARTTAASDWVDYALDQQTVTGAGGTVKVSSAYSQTWSNGQGQWYQTNNPNANPNGVLQGNWTPATQVHGNGQPK